MTSIANRKTLYKQKPQEPSGLKGRHAYRFKKKKKKRGYA
jgi:hypothetical protein